MLARLASLRSKVGSTEAHPTRAPSGDEERAVVYGAAVLASPSGWREQRLNRRLFELPPFPLIETDGVD